MEESLNSTKECRKVHYKLVLETFNKIEKFTDTFDEVLSEIKTLASVNSNPLKEDIKSMGFMIDNLFDVVSICFEKITQQSDALDEIINKHPEVKKYIIEQNKKGSKDDTSSDQE